MDGDQAKQAAACSAKTGPYQEQVERYLGLPEDGEQSTEDCAAIQALQVELEMTDTNGYADIATYRAALFSWARSHKDELTGCPDGTSVVVCIDMDRQLLWIEDAGTISFGPVPARTGMPRYPTHKGWHEIFDRKEEFWSTLYDAPMPFSQFFDGGQALHASYRPIFEDPGSHGCVNLRYDDAKALWSGLRMGDAVYVWGTRSGS